MKIPYTAMKNNYIAKQLLEEVSLTQSDVARLALEAIESLGELAQGLSRMDLIMLLRGTLREGVAAMKAATRTVTLETAAWASVEARRGLRATSRRDLRHFVRRILRVEGAAAMPLRSVTTAQCKNILSSAFGNSASSYLKGRAILHSIFTYGMRQEWCDGNPVSRIEAPKVKEKPIHPLAPEAVEKLKETAERPEFRDMRLSLSLMLYGGIRPTEVSRLQARDFNWEERQVIVRPSVSKTGGGRAVPLRGIQAIRKNERRIPRDWKRKWRALRQAAGFRHWTPDVCRHTFASYHAAYFRNLSELQLEMGHRDAGLLRSRYMVPVLKREAAAFWHGAGREARRKRNAPVAIVLPCQS